MNIVYHRILFTAKLRRRLSVEDSFLDFKLIDVKLFLHQVLSQVFRPCLLVYLSVNLSVASVVFLKYETKA